MKNQKEFNYRKFYEQSLEIKIPDGFAIHHIDFNHFNNELDNLLAIPNNLHLRYHMWISGYKQLYPFTYKVGNHQNQFNTLLSINEDYIKHLQKFNSIAEEFIPYVSAKSKLMIEKFNYYG